MDSSNIRPPSEGEALRLISVKEVASLLSVSQRTLWRLLDAGKMIQPIRLGSAVRWRIDEIHKWIAEGCPAIQSHRNRSRR